MAYSIDWLTNTLYINNFPETIICKYFDITSFSKFVITSDCNYADIDLSKLQHATELRYIYNPKYPFVQNIDDICKLTNLKTLELPSLLDRELTNNDMNKLTRLRCLSFGSDFNTKLDYQELVNLEKISFNNTFNQEIDLSHLTKLKSVKLGHDFNQLLDNKLPEALQELILGTGFNHPVDNLPNSLEILFFFSDKYYHNLNLLPDGIKTLMLPKDYTVDIVKLPAQIQSIFVSHIKLEQIKELVKNNDNIKVISY